MKIKKVPLQCRKKRHYNDTIFQLKQHVSWENGPDSHFGMTQKLKYKIIVAQDIVGVKCNQTIYAIKHQTIYALKQYIAELKRIVFLQKISGRAKEVIAGTLKKIVNVLEWN